MSLRSRTHPSLILCLPFATTLPVKCVRYGRGNRLRRIGASKTPQRSKGDDETKRKAFLRAFTTLQRRLDLFLSLPLEKLDKLALKEQLDSIGKVD